MTITKEAKRPLPESGNGAGEQFTVGTAATAAPQQRKTPVMVRFDPSLLKRVDVAAKRRGVSRSSWIQYVISQLLDEGHA